ncbi:vesicle transport protein SFT2B [Dermatophagoides farinae]|uniref:Vesicle transport protein n=1 Tax=Dermatophagoides farinae TaxID=6954 RepID=A0A922L771_DERFA|nr:vesicle transport protein SFT2B-like [Dermatophagoides farinae]KAH7639489.1 vesicle transport protein sft2a-like protein [Dermatophagoides farinae]KAH9521858.1 Vesicle transport protein SFT2B [Dermatophagoides farinae]
MDKLRRVLNGNDMSGDEGEGFAQLPIGDSSSLDWSTRIKGFIICFVLGFIMSIIGTALIPLPRGLALFALFYTLGNGCSIASTMFLMGPWRQMKKMFSEKRVISTALVIVFMVLTLLAALVWKKSLLAIIFCCLQFFAYIWYSISYIPYAQESVTKAFMSCI